MTDPWDGWDFTDTPQLRSVEPPDLDDHRATGPDTGRAWAPIDLADVLGAVDRGDSLRPETGILRRDDGAGMLYPGKIHAIMGEPESLKTWLALVAVAQTACAGGTTLWVDLEDSPATFVERLVALGLTTDQIAAHCHYLQPEVGLLAGKATVGPAVQSLRATIAATNPTLIVIDSVSELAALQGLSILDNDDMTRQSAVIKRMAQESDAAVLMIDHVAKSTEGRGRWAIGAQAKQAAITGAAFTVTCTQPLSEGGTGRATIAVAKDRAGAVRSAARSAGTSTTQEVATLTLTSDPETLRIGWELTAPEGGPHRPTVLMGRVSAYLAEHGPSSKRAVRAGVPGKTVYVSRALDLLVGEGYVACELSPTSHTYRSVRPFDEADEF